MEVQLNFYSDSGLTIALNITRFPEEYLHKPMLIIKALNYITSHHKKIKERIDIPKIATNIFLLFQKRRQHIYAEEAGDCLFRYNGTLLIYREEKREEIKQENRPEIKIEKKSVYDDKQNVHNSKINKSVINSAEYLYRKNKNILEEYANEEENYKNKIYIIEQIKKYLSKKYPQREDVITQTSEYIINSSSTFGNGVKLQDIFISIWFFITEHKDREELEKRLVQELSEMKGQCATGHLSRLINVLQGFTEDINLIIKISDADQYNSVVRNYIQNKLSECRDEKIIEESITGGENYISYIRIQIALKLREWVKEYGESILDYIPKIVNDYANFEIFNVS